MRPLLMIIILAVFTSCSTRHQNNNAEALLKEQLSALGATSIATQSWKPDTAKVTLEHYPEGTSKDVSIVVATFTKDNLAYRAFFGVFNDKLYPACNVSQTLFPQYEVPFNRNTEAFEAFFFNDGPEPAVTLFNAKEYQRQLDEQINQALNPQP